MFQCEKCGIEFTTEMGRSLHISFFEKRKINCQTNVTVDKQLDCQQCGFITFNAVTLARHLRRCMSGIKCEQCDKKFSSKNSLANHMRKFHHLKLIRGKYITINGDSTSGVCS